MATDENRIVSLEGLHEARAGKRSVVVPQWNGFKAPKPAAFLMNLSGELLLRMFKSGMFLHPKKERRWAGFIKSKL